MLNKYNLFRKKTQKAFMLTKMARMNRSVGLQKDQPITEQKKQELVHEKTGLTAKPKSKRIATLDAFRGLAIVVRYLL